MNILVEEPTIVIISKVSGEYSNSIEHFIIKKTPAVTIVAACIKADTGVGPSIASGNQVCKPICADLPTAPINNKIEINVILSTSNPQKTKAGFLYRMCWAINSEKKYIFDPERREST